MKKTKIVITVGPGLVQVSSIESLIKAGTDVVRINASHTSPDGIREWVRKIRLASSRAKKTVGILVDLQGPRLRTGKLKDEMPIFIKTGETICIEPSHKPGVAGWITTSCFEFPKMVKVGDRVLLDNGFMELRVLQIKGRKVFCKVIMGGLLKENKGINLPNAPITLPALTRKDLNDLKTIIEVGVDFIALSFVRTEKDVALLKRWLKARNKNIPVIAKIEKPKAFERIDEILAVSDGIMVARGDLGIELGVEKVPAIQKILIQKANRVGLPVITATQMLESMIEISTPTRAEVSDVANAVFDGTDAVMLSGETAVGKYALKTVQVMGRIVLEAEKSLTHSTSIMFPKAGAEQHEQAAVAVARAARSAQNDLKADAIVVFTLSGKTVRLVSKSKPDSLVIALCSTVEVARRLILLRGVVPLTIRHSHTTDQMIDQAERVILNAGLLKKGDMAVLVSGRRGLPDSTYMITVQRIGLDL